MDLKEERAVYKFNKQEKEVMKMVKITLLDGPYAGQSRRVSLQNNPMELLKSAMLHNWKWKLDFSKATEEEVFLFGRADFIIRIIRALFGGKKIKFLDYEFQILSSHSEEEAIEIAQAAEDAIVEGGYYVYIANENENEIVIGIGPQEHPTQ